MSASSRSGKVSEDLLVGPPSCELPQNRRDRDAEPSDARKATHLLWVDGDPLELHPMLLDGLLTQKVRRRAAGAGTPFKRGARLLLDLCRRW